MNELLVQLQRDIAVNSIEKGFYKDYMKVWSQLQTKIGRASCRERV